MRFYAQSFKRIILNDMFKRQFFGKVMGLKDRLQSVMGAEDFIDLPDVPAVVHEEVVDTAELASADLAVMENDVALDQVQQDIDRTEDKVEYLQERLDGLESMMNGSRPWNGALAQTWFSDCNTVMVKSFGTPLSAVLGSEGFDNPATTQLQLVAGVEGIKEGLAKFGSAVKKFFENLYNMLAGFFKGMFDVAAKTEKRAIKVHERVKNLNADRFRTKVDLGAWNLYIDVEARTDNIGKGITMTGAGSQELQAWLKSPNYDNVHKTLRSAMQSFCDNGGKKTPKSSDENTETVLVNLAGMAYTLRIPKENPKDIVQAVKNTRFTFTSSRTVKASSNYFMKQSVSNQGLKTFLYNLSKLLRDDAEKARKRAVSPSEIKSAKAKALAAIDKNDESKDKIALIKAGSSAVASVAKTLTKIELNMIRAGVTFVGLHLPLI